MNTRGLSRAGGVALRAAVAAAVVAAPQLIGGPPEATPLVALFALVAAIFVAVEYAAPAPSLVEFRDAGPFNRLRVAAVALTATGLALALAAEAGRTSPLLLAALAERLGEALDVPASPVRLLLAVLPDATDPGLVADLRAAGAVAWAASLLMVGAFALALALGWPGGRAFNVWVNLPQFDPTAGGDVVGRLRREAALNVLLGIALPFLVPAVVALAWADPRAALATDPALIWTAVAWAFFPASLLMRGLAVARVARLIAEERARALGGGWQPA